MMNSARSKSLFERLSMSLALTAGLAMAVTGCTDSRNYESNVDSERFEERGNFANFTESQIQLNSARLTGDIGNVTNFDEDAAVNGSHDDNFTTLEVVMQNDRGSAMNLLQIYGGLDNDQLAPGSRLSFDYNSPDYSGNAVFVDGIACSGQGAPGDWSYDEPLESVELEVEAGQEEGERRLYFTTVTGGQEASGFVDLIIE